MRCAVLVASCCILTLACDPTVPPSPQNADTRPQVRWDFSGLGGGDLRSEGNGVATNGVSIYVTGSYSGVSGVGGLPTSSNHSDDVFLIKYSTGGTVEWAKSAGGAGADAGMAVALDRSGNPFVAGFTGADAFVSRYGQDGTLVWSAIINGAGLGRVIALTTDVDGNSYVTGSYSGTLTLHSRQGNAATQTLNASGGTDIFIARYDPNGAIVWARSGGGPGTDAANGIAVSSDGASISVVGSFSNSITVAGTTVPAAGGTDGWVAKLDRNGTVIWVRAIGGSDADDARSVAVAPAGDVLVAGTFRGRVAFTPASVDSSYHTLPNGPFDNNDVYLLRLSTDGAPNSVSTVGGPGDDAATSLSADAQGIPFLLGASNGNYTVSDAVSAVVAPGYEIWLLRDLPATNPQWRMARVAEHQSRPNRASVAVAQNGTHVITGTLDAGFAFIPPSTMPPNGVGHAMFVVSHAADHAVVWKDELEDIGSGNGNAVAATSGADYIAGASGTSMAWRTNQITIAGGRSDGFLASVSPDWAVAIGGPNADEVTKVVATNTAAYVTGVIEPGATFHSVSGATASAGNTTREMFFAKYTTVGELQWLRRAGGTAGTAEGSAMAMDRAGNIYVAGLFGGNAAFTSATGGTTLNAVANQTNLFIAKYDPSGALLYARRAGVAPYLRAFALTVDANGNIYVAGIVGGSAVFGSNNLASNADAVPVGYVARFTDAGAASWVQRIASPSSRAYDVAVDSSGNPVVVGQFEQNAQFGSQSFTPRGGTDAFVAKFDANGTVLWARQEGGTGADGNRGAAINSSGDVFTTGSFVGSASFAFANNTLVLEGGSGVSGFVARYLSDGRLIDVIQVGGDGSASPVAIAMKPSSTAGTPAEMIRIAGTAGQNPTLGVQHYRTASSYQPFYLRSGPPY